LWDVNPLNLFRITWHNEPAPQGGGFGGVNYLELPSSLTGTKARVIVLIGKWFPHRRAQSRRGVRLSGAAARHRPIRPDDAKGCVAFDR